MIKKKLLCVLLALCLMVSPIMSVCVNATESNDIQKVSLSLYSNLTSDKYISGLYKDNVFYITTENLCRLTGAEIISETAEEVRINLSKGMRQFCVDVGSGNMQEILETDEFNITMPSLFFEDKVYISAIHFLRYIGATVQIQEDSDCQFMVIKRYDIFDAWADYVESDYGNFFWWDEVHIGNGDIESELTKAGVIALINRDSNVFRMMFDAEGIEQEALEDALLSIVKNEGQSYFVDESPESELIGTYSDLIGAESDWFGLITEAYSDGSDELAKQIGGLAESAAVASGFASNVVEAFEGLKQFDNMSTAQKNLLEKTILTHSDDSETLCDGWNVVYDAAYNINGKIQSEYDAQYKAALDASEATAYDFLNGATSAAGANPVSIAWSGVNLLTKLIPYTNEFIEKETQLYNSYNCSIIQLIANEIFTESVLDWCYSNGMVSNLSNQIGKLESSKYALILQLKSTITARECLLDSGYLNGDDAAEMHELNRETANLLNRTESCKITGVNFFDAEYDDDISWIENYTSISKEQRYKAYAEKIQDYESKYGLAQKHTESEWFTFMTGLCFMRLIDFSNNGQEDLMLVYQSNPESVLETFYSEYKYEIWGFEEGKLTMLETGDLFGTDGGETHIILTEYNEKVYLVTGGADSFGRYYYHSYLNNEFEVVREVLWEDNSNGQLVGTINGESVSYDVIEEQQEEWLYKQTHYSLMYDCDKILEQNEETKQMLSPYYQAQTGSSENETIMSAEEIYDKLVEYYKKGTPDSPGDDLTVMRGEMNDENQYCTSVRCGVPGNSTATQRLYDIVVDGKTGNVIQTRVLVDNQIVEFNLNEE